MKNNRILIAITLTNLLLFLASCGNNPANAANSYRLENLFGYECITNDVSIWCR